MKPFKSRMYLAIITLVASMGGLLFGFDIAVISGVLPMVQKQFALTAVEEGWFVTSALIGSVIGVAFSGDLADRFGRKKMLIASAILFFLSAVGCTLLPDTFSIISARMIGGVAIGIASIVVPLYISEIAPARIRGRLVTCYQLAVTVGILAAYLTNAAVLNYSIKEAGPGNENWWQLLFVEEAWRGMFSVLIVPSLLFFCGLTMVPESPRWLILSGRLDDARLIVANISGDPQSADAEVAQISNRNDRRNGSYRLLLQPGLRKALFIGLSLPLLSQFSGINAIIYYGPTILQQAGIPLSDSLMSQIVFGIAIVLFTLVAIWKVDEIGRRKLYLFGTASATVSLFLTGFCFYYGFNSGILLLICVVTFLASFAISIGPLKFVVASEIFPNAIRSKALSLSIMMMWIADAIVGQLTPVSLRLWGTAPTFWVFAAFCAIGFFVVLATLPETKGKSLEEIGDSWKLIH